MFTKVKISYVDNNEDVAGSTTVSCVYLYIIFRRMDWQL